jgi:hypothetical protein
MTTIVDTHQPAVMGPSWPSPRLWASARRRAAAAEGRRRRPRTRTHDLALSHGKARHLSPVIVTVSRHLSKIFVTL